MSWQPIDTAPKDRTVIWCYLPEWDEQVCLRWVSFDDWEGWLYVESVLNDCLGIELEPTHWMPLPEPPK